METKQYSAPLFELVKRGDTERVFFMTSACNLGFTSPSTGGAAPAGTSMDRTTTGWFE